MVFIRFDGMKIDEIIDDLEVVWKLPRVAQYLRTLIVNISKTISRIENSKIRILDNVIVFVLNSYCFCYNKTLQLKYTFIKKKHVYKQK